MNRCLCTFVVFAALAWHSQPKLRHHSSTSVTWSRESDRLIQVAIIGPDLGHFLASCVHRYSNECYVTRKSLLNKQNRRQLKTEGARTSEISGFLYFVSNIKLRFSSSHVLISWLSLCNGMRLKSSYIFPSLWKVRLAFYIPVSP